MKIRNSKLCKRLFINNLICISMTTNNILLFVAKGEGLTKFADKLIYSGFILSVGVIASLFSLLNSFPEKNNYRLSADKFMEDTLKKMQSLKKICIIIWKNKKEKKDR